MDYIIRDIGLAPEGEARINWVKKYMPLLNTLEREFIKDQPFKDKKVSISTPRGKDSLLGLSSSGGWSRGSGYRQ